ncbi:MAG: DAK2 domain-containing protein [Acidimicrobiales bacterium]|nr:DAK2 domain-containing protein [Acidimicrobiales bacterium]MYD84452.1 DAK2 domain-containing protein [Acidimicrobiales bacterium]MYJ64882.1 DAK2 domain-containing protein [Acidimicrobiales bacterium]
MSDGEPRTAAGPLATLDSDALAEAIRTYRAALDQHRVTIDRLNVYPVPDGDTGTNMALTLAAVSEELGRAGTGRADVCRAISHGALMGARGNSGVIVSQLLRGLTAALAPSDDDPETEPPIDACSLASGLAAASTAADNAVMQPVEGTILSVARASAQAAEGALGTLANDDDAALATVLERARRAGQAALEATPQQLSVLADAGVVDAGAAGYLLLLDALLCVVDGRPVPDEVELPAEVAAVIAHGNAGGSLRGDPVDPVAEQHAELHSHLDRCDGDGHDAHDPSGTRYEVMFLLDAPDENIDRFKAAWDGLGDSIVMVGGDGLWNCHIHTDDIGPVIEAGIDVGRPHRIQITDLHEQVAGLGAHGAHAGAGAHGAHAGAGAHGAHAGAGMHTGRSTATADRPQVECAIVAVSPATGLDGLFTALGAQEIVTGGQTMNPSTAELLAAVTFAPSQQVVVLPNNSNIVPVARQVGAQTAKQVQVVPTMSVPAGLAALIGYDPDASADANAASMGDAADAVLAGEVTQAVRATSSPIGNVAAGEWIGLTSDGIAASGENPAIAAVGLLAHMLRPGHELLTMIEGAGADDAHTREVASWLAEHWPDVEVERHVGGQDHYPYLFGLE